MTGWSIDVTGVQQLLASLDGEMGGLRSAVADAGEAFAECEAALRGPVAASFASFAATRQAAPAEVTTLADTAAAGAVGAVAALAAGNESMAEQMRQQRIWAAGLWSYDGFATGVQPW